MKISTQTRYSLRILSELAMHAETGIRITTHQIAESQGLSEKYLESITTKLQKNGLVTSSKGFGGGYRLALPAEEITLGMVMRMMETNYFVTHCVKDPEINCKIYSTCVIHEFLDRIEEALSGVVDNVTIQDICTRYAQKNGPGDGDDLACADGEGPNILDIDEFLLEREAFPPAGHCGLHEKRD